LSYRRGHPLVGRWSPKGAAQSRPPVGEPQRNGHRLQFGTNHLGHFALTGLLLDRLLPVSGSRVVTVSSTGHRIQAAIHFDDLQRERSYNRVGAYGQAKLANLMFTYELQRRLAPNGTAIAVAAHPGVSNTEFTRNTPAALRVPVGWFTPMLTRKPAMGALPTVRTATDLGVLGASTTAAAAEVRSADTRGSSHPAPRLTTRQSSSGCGLCPSSAPE
jgi:NAD(P)-dependent dehydrogenase (short-subunit alcohol dehydrogenase family)